MLSIRNLPLSPFLPVTLYEIYRKVADNPLCEGITFSGGEPFLYIRQLRMLAEAIHNLGKTVWAYTGWVLEELILRKDAVVLLDNRCMG